LSSVSSVALSSSASRIRRQPRVKNPVWTLKTSDNAFGGRQTQLGQNVVLHFGRRRRREGQGGRPFQHVAGLSQRQVVRPKIVTPLRDAMRFVDGQQ
jgi:hypothetical protein